MKIKLSEWAKLNGVCYRTAWNRFKAGKFGESCEVNDSGSIFVIVEDVKKKDECEGILQDLRANIEKLTLILRK